MQVQVCAASLSNVPAVESSKAFAMFEFCFDSLTLCGHPGSVWFFRGPARAVGPHVHPDSSSLLVALSAGLFSLFFVPVKRGHFLSVCLTLG